MNKQKTIGELRKLEKDYHYKNTEWWVWAPESMEKIKDRWKDCEGCKENYLSFYCGEIDEYNYMHLCLNCKKERKLDKEAKEIFERCL